MYLSFHVHTFTWAQINESIASLYPTLFPCVGIFHVHVHFSVTRPYILFYKEESFYLA